MKNGVITAADGSKRWFHNDKLHRTDGPAVEHTNGDLEWWRFGVLHREDGPAYSSEARSLQVWYKQGSMHREDGPAYVDLTSGDEEWHRNGFLHRTDGPACTFGKPISGWEILAEHRNAAVGFEHDRMYSHVWAVNAHIAKSAAQYQRMAGLTDQQMVELVLKYGDI